MAKALGPLPYFKWYWRDWRSNRKVKRMGYVARGLYRELLDEFWSEGILPDDMALLAEICECPVEVMELHWPEIEPCWERVEGGWQNRKMDEVRTELDGIRAINARAGRRSAEARMSKKAAPATASAALAQPSSTAVDDCSIAEQEQSISKAETEGGGRAAAASPEASASVCFSSAEQNTTSSVKSLTEPALSEPQPPGDATALASEISVSKSASRITTAYRADELRLQEIVARVHASYLIHTGKPAEYHLSRKRRLHAMCRAEELWKRHRGDLQRVETDMLRAVKNLAASKWHRENNLLDWLLIFGSEDAFSQRLAMNATNNAIARSGRRFSEEDFDHTA